MKNEMSADSLPGAVPILSLEVITTAFLNHDYRIITPEQYLPVIEFLIGKAKEDLDRKYIQAGRTIDNTLLATDRLTKDLDDAFRAIVAVEQNLCTPTHASAYKVAKEKYTAFASELSRDVQLFHAIYELSLTEAGRTLTGSDKRFMSETLKAFERNGIHLEQEKRTALNDIDVRLGSLATQYKNHLVQARALFHLHVPDEASLAGLPLKDKNAAARFAEGRGLEGFLLTLDPSLVASCMRYLEDANLREKLYRAQISLASDAENNNLPVEGDVGPQSSEERPAWL